MDMKQINMYKYTLQTIAQDFINMDGSTTTNIIKNNLIKGFYH